MDINRLKEIILEIRPDVDFEVDKDFIDNGIFDSLDVVAIISALEKELKSKIKINKITSDDFNTLEDILKIVENQNV